MSALKESIRQVRDYMDYLKEEGIREIEVTPETMKLLNQPRKKRSTSKKTVSATPAATRPAPVSSRPVAEPVPKAGAGLADVARRVASCTLCPLHSTRTNTVPGQGHSHPEIMFIGEGPGQDEDLKGLAFVGRAGQLLTKIIEAMGFTRDEVFIGNIVKCRPPNNRVPLPDEMSACLPYLHEQIALLKPKVIVALGGTAVKGLFQTQTGITKLRGQWMSYQGIDCMPTYHPAYLLRNPPEKKWVWEDMKEVLAHLGRKPPSRT